jgi:hypothetical protein
MAKGVNILETLVNVQTMTEDEVKAKFKANSRTVTKVLKTLLLDELQAEAAEEEVEVEEGEGKPAKAERKPKKTKEEKVETAPGP